jgi:NAD(P)-dependent dehydrogenase (short-subunit alcohol dehydrogenase family)
MVVDKLLAGQRALVTGAGRNIGRSIARELAAHGADVYCTELDGASAERLAAELRAFPVASRVFQADVTVTADTDRVLSSLRDAGVTIDHLVNNVGIVGDDFAAAFATNVTGPMYLTDRIAAAMRDSGKPGSIIFLSSIHEATVFLRNRAYAPTKAAIAMLVKQLAVQLAADRIRVNAIAPGDVREDQQGNVERYGYTPLEGTSLRPQYIARAAVYLSSDYFSRYTTGSTVTIDGGLSLFNYQCAYEAGLFL